MRTGASGLPCESRNDRRVGSAWHEGARRGVRRLGTVIVCCATYGAATFALGLGLGYDLATIIACAVFVSAVMLFDRR
jgi:hypothetical protein